MRNWVKRLHIERSNLIKCENPFNVIEDIDSFALFAHSLLNFGYKHRNINLHTSKSILHGWIYSGHYRLHAIDYYRRFFTEKRVHNLRWFLSIVNVKLTEHNRTKLTKQSWRTKTVRSSWNVYIWFEII